MAFADIGYQIYGYAVEPWVRNPNVTHAFSNRMSRITFVNPAAKGDGAKVSIAAGQKGGQNLVTLNGNAAYFGSSNGRSGVARISDPVGTSSSMVNNVANSGTLAVGQSGTAKPLGLTIAFQLPVIPDNPGATNAQWMLWSFFRDASVNPYYTVIGNRRSPNCNFQRRTDSGFGSDTSSTITLNLNWNILTTVYTGTSMTVRLNQVYIDNALPALTGGPTTLDGFSIGAFARPGAGGLFSDLNWTDCILGVGKVWTSADWDPIETYLKRKLGL